jgi:hypothetical protein
VEHGLTDLIIAEGRAALCPATILNQNKNMGTTTGIRWTDSTVNFFSGCTKVSPGCL